MDLWPSQIASHLKKAPIKIQSLCLLGLMGDRQHECRSFPVLAPGLSNPNTPSAKQSEFPGVLTTPTSSRDGSLIPLPTLCSQSASSVPISHTEPYENSSFNFCTTLLSSGLRHQFMGINGNKHLGKTAHGRSKTHFSFPPIQTHHKNRNQWTACFSNEMAKRHPNAQCTLKLLCSFASDITCLPTCCLRPHHSSFYWYLKCRRADYNHLFHLKRKTLLPCCFNASTQGVLHPSSTSEDPLPQMVPLPQLGIHRCPWILLSQSGG